MPLKPSYASEAEVPTERKADYVLKGGRYVLDVEGFDNIDSVLAKNTELLGKVSGHASQLAEKDTEITRLKGEIASANIVPRGHKPVLNADAELVDAVKAQGITTPDAFKTLHTEYGQYKTEAEGAKASKRAAAVGEAMGWDKDKTERLATKVYDFSTLEVRDVDGKKVVVAKVKQADNTFVEKSFADVVKATPELSDLLPSLTPAAGGTRVPGSTGGAGTPPVAEDMVEQRRKDKEAARANNPNALMPPKPAAATA